MILLATYFGLLNRFRGGLSPLIYDKYYPNKYLPRNFDYFVLFTLGLVSYGVALVPSLCISLAFWIGALDGWGKWIGQITDNAQTQNEKEGMLGIAQWIGQKLSPSNYYNECVISLSIRGLQWILLPYLVLFYYGYSHLWILILLGVSMPYAYMFATRYFNDGWTSGEVIYGVMQGFALSLILGGLK
jgi:hypothetical protein